MNKAILARIAVLPLAVAATATQAGQPVDNYGAKALSSAQFQRVVTMLEPIVAHDRGDESLLLNLAMAYRYTGRHAEATRLYQRVLAMENAELDMANGGTITSHEVAHWALAQPIRLSVR